MSLDLVPTSGRRCGSHSVVSVIFIASFMVMADCASSHDLPTLYQYYTEGGVKTGLSDNQAYFTLNNKNVTLYSGALHYFRVPKDYWRDRLRKYRAAGLNAVETYVPWNLHEYENGVLDFGSGESDFEDFLDVVHFIELAKEEDLFVILRPGPYICAEWEFGGLPSWLMRYDDIKVRTSDKQYIHFVERYYRKLFQLLSPLQFTKGGAIIAVQIENEYGNTKIIDEPVDKTYLEKLRDILLQNGVVELLFTADTPSNGFWGTLPGVLATANFQSGAHNELALLKNFQPNKPMMVMEYWSGWYDHWTDKHHTTTAEEFGRVLDEILTHGASVNMYMFHGGTNWGFLNGANIEDDSSDNKGYQPDITSYDYDAPLSEAGDYTEKYHKTRELISKNSEIRIRQPDLPQLNKRLAYSPITIIGELSLEDLVKQTGALTTDKLVPMELLPINNGSGQSYGYIVYRKANLNIPKNSVLKIEGRVCDTVLVLINGQLKSKILESKEDFEGFGYWKLQNSSLNLGDEYKNATLDLVVENWGRVNYGKLHQFNQHKGLWQGDVLLNDDVLAIDQIIPLEFKKSWNNALSNWKSPSFGSGPKLYRSILNVEEPKDTYVDMRGWNKGIIIVNGFVLGRYLKLGPQLSTYLPAPFLKRGQNELLIFEHFSPSKRIEFVEDLIFVKQNSSKTQ